jgi:hypothetical protein
MPKKTINMRKPTQGIAGPKCPESRGGVLGEDREKLMSHTVL